MQKSLNEPAVELRGFLTEAIAVQKLAMARSVSFEEFYNVSTQYLTETKAQGSPDCRR
jgi:hypothetical protein